MSDIRTENTDTRFQELQKAWEEQHPWEPYPVANWVWEKVWLPETAKDKKATPVPTPEAFSEQVALNHKKIETELAKPGRKDWPPAVWNPEAEHALSKSLEAWLSSVA